MLDRRTTRFMGGGAAWNYIAMRQAIQDAGLEDGRGLERAHRHHHGLGRPLDARHRRGRRRHAREGRAKRVGPFAVPKAMSSTNSATLATPFKIKGVNYSISSACATSNHCIGNAYEMIQFGKQDVIFAGGGEELDWTLSILFDGMGAMSTGYNDTPEKASRAYDAKRDGFVIAGGAGVVVLEELEHAKARGAKIYGEITGYGATSDGFDMVQPSGEGAARCMRMALSTVKEPIDYINPHATSTPIGDEREIDAIREVFGSGDNCPPISATKSLTGHSLGATGVQETIYCLLMMQNGFICESANIDELDPKFADMPIVRERRDGVELEYRAVQLLRLRRNQRHAGVPALRRMRKRPMSGLMAGKRGLIMGVANDHSIAWGIAKQLAAEGAELAFTYQGEHFGRRVNRSPTSLGSTLLFPCDVEDAASIKAVFDALRDDWGSLDFVVHAIAFSDKAELKGRYADTSRENFARTMQISCFSFTEVARHAAALMTKGGSCSRSPMAARRA